MTNSPGNEYADDLTVPDTGSADAPDGAVVDHSPDHVDAHGDAAGEVAGHGGAGATDTVPAAVPTTGTVRRSVAGSTWVGLTIGALILILLLVFILQNQESVRLQMFVWQWNFPIGVGMLIAAIAGALVMASVGAVRILQLRRQINHPAGAKDTRSTAGRRGRKGRKAEKAPKGR
ncbi:LapA family protein [Corynebacterium kalidii]